MDKFWICYVEKVGTCPHRHLTLDSAKQEATRLALLKNNEGLKVYVLEMVGYCQTATPPVEWHTLTSSGDWHFHSLIHTDEL